MAGAVATAAQMNAHVRDNLKALLPGDQVAWVSYAPTLAQNGAKTKTVNYAKWTQLGNLVIANIYLSCTQIGTANNAISVTLPATAQTVALNAVIGSGQISNAGNSYPSAVLLVNTTTIQFLDTTASTTVYQGQTGAAFGIALASGTVITCQVAYEV